MTGTITFDCSCGLLIRGGFRGFLEREKFKLSDICNIEWHEDKGLLGSHFTIKIKGNSEKINQVYAAFMRVFRELEKED